MATQKLSYAVEMNATNLQSNLDMVHLQNFNAATTTGNQLGRNSTAIDGRPVNTQVHIPINPIPAKNIMQPAQKPQEDEWVKKQKSAFLAEIQNQMERARVAAAERQTKGDPIAGAGAGVAESLGLDDDRMVISPIFQELEGEKDNPVEKIKAQDPFLKQTTTQSTT